MNFISFKDDRPSEGRKGEEKRFPQFLMNIDNTKALEDIALRVIRTHFLALSENSSKQGDDSIGGLGLNLRNGSLLVVGRKK